MGVKIEFSDEDLGEVHPNTVRIEIRGANRETEIVGSSIGGGVIERQPHLLARVERMLIASLAGYMHLPEVAAYIRAPELGGDAGPLGAIALAMTARL